CLIRLNPNIPYKTRGNGACYFKVDSDNEEKIINTVLNFVEKYSKFECENTNPGVVFLDDKNFEKNFEILNKFYKKAVSELCKIEEAEDIAKKVNAKFYKFKNGRGIIGALASLGCDFNDFTYELLVYRKEENFGKERKIDEESVFEMNKLLYPETFDNVNEEEHKVVFMPHGKDPVLCGIRGNSIDVVEKAFSMVKFLEDINFYKIFKTNQHTDAHLKFKKISELKQYDAAIVEGILIENPRRIEKGHTFFKISDGTGIINVAAYGVTKLKDVAINLIKGDKVRIYGGIGKYKDTINAEKIEILELKKIFKRENPICEKCNRRMKSEGKNKGFQCRKCKAKLPESAAKFIEIKRNLELKIYEVQPGRRRHLSKPLCRYK
ncbi:MAG: DUF1743 domain-containing protein, partial [Candidatus Altarchaeaceae archaeon]